MSDELRNEGKYFADFLQNLSEDVREETRKTGVGPQYSLILEIIVICHRLFIASYELRRIRNGNENIVY